MSEENENKGQAAGVSIKPEETVDRDIFLELLITGVEGAEKNESVAEEEKHFDITLNVGGILVSGTVISRDNFIAEVPFIKATIGRLDAQRTPEQQVAANEIVRSGRRHFIHLKDAVFFTDSGRPIPGVGGGVYWRGQLNRVDGWTIGRFEMSKDRQ